MNNRGSRGASRGNRGGTAGGGGASASDRGRSNMRGGGGGFRARPTAQIFQADIPAQVDSRINTSDDLVKSFRTFAISNERPLRPGYGTLGRSITLRANFFAVRVPNAPIFDYSVEITPKADVKSQPMRSRVFRLLEESPQMSPYRNLIAHDNGARLVSARRLDQPLTISITYFEEGEPHPRTNSKVFEVTINFIREMDMTDLTKYTEGGLEHKNYDPLPIISALNLVLQQYASTVAVRFGKNRYFFPSGQNRPALSPALDAWRGFYTSVRPAYKQLMVNVNVCMTAFYHGGSLMSAIEAFSQRSKGAMPQAFPQRVKIITNHLGYPMKKQLKKVLGTNPSNTFFECAEYGGGMISVAQYFKRKYNINLNPALPVIDVGGSEKHTYLPAEICTLAENQPYTGKLFDTETANMIKFACNPPATNAFAIADEGLGLLGFHASKGPVNGFGVSIEANMAVVPARILPAPRLSYAGNKATNAQNGSWNILDVKFQRPGILGPWLVVVVQDFGQVPFQGPQDPALTQLTNGFWTKLKTSGIDAKYAPMISPTPRLPPPTNDPHRQKALGLIEQTIKSSKTKPSLILFLLCGRDDFIYPGIKRLCDMQLGIASVCMLISKAVGDSRKQDQYFSNVALKVNAKLGGINHLVDDSAMKWLKEKSTMMVGMDVTHPGPNSIQGTPSIAAVVASTDSTFSQFPASLSLQETKVEMIQDLTQMMIERLQAYKMKNKSFPQRIFVFRDGVSEGQFDLVLSQELVLILHAFKKLDDGGKPYRPTLSIVICGKRHHARFHPTQIADAAQNGNTLPGTVVDKGVTAVYDFDFYLQAHAGLQGTVRPTHYTVIYDENRFDADKIQQGTHVASYLYVRATKAVSLIPAAYYADLACERGRCYINNLFVASEKTSSVGGKRDKDAEKKRVFDEAKRMWGLGVHKDLKGTMFYI